MKFHSKFSRQIMKTKLEIILFFSAVLLEIIFLSLAGAAETPNYTRIKSVECKSLDNKTISFEFCYIKAYSRKFVTLNIKFNVGRRVQKPIYIQYIVGHKTSGNSCQQFYKSDLIEFCGLMDENNANPLVKSIINVLNYTAPQLFHKCPYEGQIEVINATIHGEKAFVLFPTGTYCAEWNFFDDKKKQIASFKFFCEIKNSFDVLDMGILKN